MKEGGGRMTRFEGNHKQRQGSTGFSVMWRMRVGSGWLARVQRSLLPMVHHRWFHGVYGRSGRPYEVVVGLEVHAQILAHSKLFSGASTGWDACPNEHVAWLDVGLPGTLPVLNRFCVEQAVRTGLALGGYVRLWSLFERKHYFYSDLPLGYQITQTTAPVVVGGEVRLSRSEDRRIRINRIQLEQDSGKHMEGTDAHVTLVDFNRAGAALMEIVTEPDLRSGEEAALFLRRLQLLLRRIGTCDGNMETGSVRCDVNVSVRRSGDPLGCRTEVKNVSSMRHVARSVEFEAQRQIALLEEGGSVRSETLLFDAAHGVTRPVRSKETLKDYRFFPEPDLLPLILDSPWVDAIRQSLPELPDATEIRLVEQYGITPYESMVLVTEQGAADFFEQVVAVHGNPKQAVAWVMGELFRHLKNFNTKIVQSPVSPPRLGHLITLVEDGMVSQLRAKDVLALMFHGDPREPKEIIEERGWMQMSDTLHLARLCDDVLASSKHQIDQFLSGRNKKLFAWFVGQVMEQTKGRANPKEVASLLRERLESKRRG